MKKKIVNCRNFKISNNSALTLISGPCQMESEKHALNTAEKIMNIASDLKINFIYKTSFDKANRTSLHGKRGIGLENSLNVFKKIKDNLKIPVITDVHDIEQCKIIAEVVDVIQIPAFLCRQTDLIQKACETDCIVNIKKGQFLAPWDVKGILSKTEGAKDVWITERGTSFGYNTLVVDFTGMSYLLESLGDKFVFDATHSVQKPGGQGSSSGGDRTMVPGLVRAASALGVSSFFLEVHRDPDNAPSDGPNMLHLKDFKKVVEEIHAYSYTNTSKISQ